MELNANNKRIYGEGAPFSSDLIVDENFHLKRFSAFLSVIVLVLVTGIIIIAVAFSVVTNRPPLSLSYAVDSNGVIVELEPVSQPYSPAEIIGFTSKTVESALHLSFTDYKDHLLNVSTKFTDKGFEDYQTQLIQKSWLSKITDDNLTMWSEILNAPKILSAGPVDGVYEYELAFDINLFLGGGEKIYAPTKISVEVKVVRSRNNLDGLKIKRLLMAEAIN